MQPRLSIYMRRESELIQKRLQRLQRLPRQLARALAKDAKCSKWKQVQLDVSGDGSGNDDTHYSIVDSEEELENWEGDLDMDISDSPVLSVITVAKPNMRPLGIHPPVTPSTSLPKASSLSHIAVPVTPHRYVARSRAAHR